MGTGFVLQIKSLLCCGGDGRGERRTASTSWLKNNANQIYTYTVWKPLNLLILCSITFLPKNRAVYEIMWKNTVQPDKPQMAIQYGACGLHAG
jgi:hypothetical protein